MATGCQEETISTASTAQQQTQSDKGRGGDGRGIGEETAGRAVGVDGGGDGAEAKISKQRWTEEKTNDDNKVGCVDGMRRREDRERDRQTETEKQTDREAGRQRERASCFCFYVCCESDENRTDLVHSGRQCLLN